jgi:ferredoxin
MKHFDILPRGYLLAHRTLKSGYSQLVDRLNRFPQGAYPSELLFEILKMLFSEKEAELVAGLPIRPFSIKKAAHIWKISMSDARIQLESLTEKMILMDIESDKGDRLYLLPPPMVGFFEFTLMRTRGDLDQKLISELFQQYLQEEDGFYRLFFEGQTQIGRVLIQEPAIKSDNDLHVFHYDRTTDIVKSARSIGVGTCFCRHKMVHLDRACDAPLDICMAFNSAAESLIRRGAARRVDAAECLDLVEMAYEKNLVQFGENVRDGVSFICNCCRCCCEAMTAARKFGTLNPVHTTPFFPEIDPGKCVGCGKCMKVCPVEALSYANAETGEGLPKVVVQEEDCIGCGICSRVCPANGISFREREERIIPPLNSTHRIVNMALERGKLQNLLFDNQALLSHRIMGAVVGAILRLPPTKRFLVGKQVNSRYIEKLCQKYSYE